MKRRAECLKEYGSDYQIRRRVEAGELFKVGKAIYSKDRYAPKIAILSCKYPHAVVTMSNAFYLHDLTDVIPEEYDFATDRNAAKIRDKRVKQYFVPSGLFAEGIETMDYEGYQIPIYSKERMLIELLRYKSKLPFDYYKEIALNYRRIMPRLSIQDIDEYASASPKSDKIYEILQTEIL